MDERRGKTKIQIARDILLVVVLTVFAAQLRVHPFDTTFRIGLGVIVFALGCLYKREMPIFLTGILVSVATLAFRTSISLWTQTAPLSEAVLIHLPGSLYYTFFAIILVLIKVRELEYQPLKRGVLLGLIDFSSNVFEVGLRFFIVEELTGIDSFPTHLLSFLVVGFLRMFFVTGLYATVQNQRLRLIRRTENKRFEELVLLTSSLQAEVFYIQKSSGDMEDLTKESYEIYKALMEKGERELGKKALYISRMMHEVKHDYTRINTGLKKLLKPPERSDYVFSELVDLSIKVHKDYSEEMEKNILFNKKLLTDFRPKAPLVWTSILNNLMANAVEAISSKGNILISLSKEGSKLTFSIEDNGEGMDPKDLDHIFIPGFSNKLDHSSGTFSSGLGLSHVENLVQHFNGEITVSSEKGKGSRFEIMVEEDVITKGVTQ